MNKYLGVKLIQAKPMTVSEYNKEVRPLFYSGECQEGYLVEYEDSYLSWSPKEVFEKAYKSIDGLTFGLAIEAVKKGLKIARKGWNGKGMFVYYIPANEYPAQTDVAKKEFGGMVSYNPYFAIKNVNGTVSTWVPSVNDCLAEDWLIVE